MQLLNLEKVNSLPTRKNAQKQNYGHNNGSERLFDILDLVKFVMCTLVSSDCLPFCRYINVICTLETAVHMTNLTRSKNPQNENQQTSNKTLHSM